ncbi:MAG: 30S ribosomal protein S27ae [Nitrosopumilaceae archaeon]
MAGGKKAAGGKKGSSPSVYKYYKVKGDKAERSRKECSRCGKGVFMAVHKNRQTCGKCGLTEFIQ